MGTSVEQIDKTYANTYFRTLWIGPGGCLMPYIGQAQTPKGGAMNGKDT